MENHPAYELPGGVEYQVDPEGRRFWIDRRPQPPSWTDPRRDQVPNELVDVHTTPDGNTFYIDRTPRITWEEPKDIAGSGAEAGTRFRSKVSQDSGKFTQSKKTLSDSHADETRPAGQRSDSSTESSSTHREVQLLLSLTRWRLAQLLSGYPDARTDDVDAIINLLNTRTSALADVSQLRPLEPWFLKAAHELISSKANLNFITPNTEARRQEDEDALDPLKLLWVSLLKPLVYFLLLGAPSNYKRRLGKSDWIQWASSKRWIDQQKAVDGFLKSLLSEWNLIILLTTLLLSATVGFLALEDLGRIPESAILVSLIFSLGSLFLSVSFVWKYQRQLNNHFDTRAIMAEFIYNADEEVLPIFLSLPVAFLLWSVICFSVGVVSYAWGKLPNKESPIGVTIAIGIVSGISICTWKTHRYIAATKRRTNWQATMQPVYKPFRREMKPLHAESGV